VLTPLDLARRGRRSDALYVDFPGHGCPVWWLSGIAFFLLRPSAVSPLGESTRVPASDRHCGLRFAAEAPPPPHSERPQTSIAALGGRMPGQCLGRFGPPGAPAGERRSFLGEITAS
jgi:hypothetical protein